jgi:metallo-beta-lactamase family protein
VIIGFQAEGTLGRRLVDGASQVRLRNETIRVAAQVHTIGGLSAHADQADLLRWYGNFRSRPPVCLVHGETQALRGLADALERKYRVRARVPQSGESIELG